MGLQIANDACNHCEAALSGSSDTSAASSLADGMKRFSVLASTGPSRASEASANGDASHVTLCQPRATPPPPCTGGKVQTHLRVVVVGASNLGKTRFIRDTAEAIGRCRSGSGCADKSALIKCSPTAASQRPVSLSCSSTLSAILDLYPDELTTSMGSLELPGEPGRVLSISVLDAPAYDVEPDQGLYLAKLLEYVLWQRVMGHRARSSSSSKDNNGGTPQASRPVLLCIYFLPQDGAVSPTDLLFMSALSEVMPLLPVITSGTDPLLVGAKQPSTPQAQPQPQRQLQPQSMGEEEEEVTSSWRAVMAAMRTYVRNGKPAPIVSLEPPPSPPSPALWVEGAALPTPPHSGDVATFLALLSSCMGKLLQSDEERFERFRECYSACGGDPMCVLSEMLEPYDQAIRDVAATKPAAATGAPMTADILRLESVVAPPPPPAQMRTRHQPMPPTPDPLLALNMCERDASSGGDPTAQCATPVAAAAVAASVPSVPLEAPSGPKVLATGGPMDEVKPVAMAVLGGMAVAQSAKASEDRGVGIEEVVTAIEEIVEKLTMSLLVAGEDLERPRADGNCVTGEHGFERYDSDLAAPCVEQEQQQEQLAEADGAMLNEEGAAVVCRRVTRRIFKAVAVNVPKVENADAVRSAVRRIFLAAVSKASTTMSAVAPVAAPVAAAPAAAVPAAAAADCDDDDEEEEEEPVEFDEGSSSYAADADRAADRLYHVSLAAAPAAAWTTSVSERALAISRVMRHGLLTMYDRLGKARFAPAAAASWPLSAPVPDAYKDATVIVRDVVDRAVAVVKAAADASSAVDVGCRDGSGGGGRAIVAAANGAVEKGEEDVDPVVSMIVRRVVARTVKGAAVAVAVADQRDSNQKDNVQSEGKYIHRIFFINSKSASGSKPSSGYLPTSRWVAVSMKGVYSQQGAGYLGASLGIGAAALTAGTLVVLMLRCKRFHISSGV